MNNCSMEEFLSIDLLGRVAAPRGISSHIFHYVEIICISCISLLFYFWRNFGRSVKKKSISIAKIINVEMNFLFHEREAREMC